MKPGRQFDVLIAEQRRVTAAGRMQLIQDLLAPPIFSEDGETIIGYGQPLITKEDAIRLMNMSEELGLE